MKLSEQTLGYLSSFSKINPSIVLREGNVIRTISPTKTVMAKAEITETIPKEAGIHDISRFLASVGIIDDCNIEFGSKKFTLRSDRTKIDYTYTATEMIVCPPEKDIVLPSVDAEFNLSWDEINNVMKAAGAMQLPEIAFTAENGKLYLKGIDVQNPTANMYEYQIGESDKDFNMVIKTENIRLLPLDYEVKLCSQGMAHFKSGNVEYWIAIQQ